jgi:hypothetical protein
VNIIFGAELSLSRIFILNIPLCDYRLNIVTSDVRHNTYLLLQMFFLCNGYMFRQTIMSSSDHSIHNIYIYKSAYVNDKYLLKGYKQEKS